MKLAIKSLVAFLFSQSLLFCQDESPVKKYPLEVGLNVTNTIKAIFSLNAQNSPLVDPYTFSLKWKSGSVYCRSGLFLNVQNKEDFVDFFPRSIKERSLGSRIGVEKRIKATKHFEFFFGWDALIQYAHRSTEQFFRDNTGTTNLSTTTGTTTYGTGPIVGLLYNFGNRFSLSTESSLYFLYSRQKRKDILDNTNIPQESIRESSSISHLIPQSLFFNYKF